MAKHKTLVELKSFGIYQHWDAKDKKLPQIQEFTLSVPARLEIEFGLIVNIKKAKGEKIYFCIYHPNIPDKQGLPMPPFDGEEYVKSNDWDFYLGDTIWDPVENKVGDWRLTVELNGQLIADKTFNLYLEQGPDEVSFWKHRGF